jgi:aspartyl-tRNA(Asn)/glutamyl-tRNA(Gln) amidotransferase subunit A
MRLPPEHDETIAAIGRRLRAGQLSCVDLLNECLRRIDARESEVHAWVFVDRKGAELRARTLDEELRNGTDRGPLHGMPIGIKDIIDVAGWPTGCGSPAATDHPAGADAPLVARLRDAGAVLLGKTVTTPWAWIDPPATRNPWKLDRTPGGSSSGSAAAVSSGMCLGAIGSQTGGSITRPAAFCGVAGLKPTFGAVSVEGVQPLAPSLDHPGPIALFVADLRQIFEVIREPSEEHGGGDSASVPPRLGRLGGYFDRRASDEMQKALKAFLKWFQMWETEVSDVEEPTDFDAVLADHRTVMAYEAGATHQERFARQPEAYPPRIAALIQEGLQVTREAYERALDARAGRIAAMLGLFDRFDALVTPAATGAAPDPSTTGDPAFNSPWSYLGFPTVSFPFGFSADRLPLAVQLIGKPGSDLSLLRTGDWLERVTRAAHRP